VPRNILGKRGFDGEEFEPPRKRLPFWLRLLLRKPRDSLLAIVALSATAAILVNGLFLQPGPHPAPIFSVKPTRAPETTGTIGVLPRPRPADLPGARSDPPRAPQDGASGRSDPGRRPSNDPAKSKSRAHANPEPAGKATSQPEPAAKANPQPAPAARANRQPEPIASANGPSRVRAVQQTLADFAYGQVKPTGIYDGETRAAIEAFERARKLPVTGQISDRLVRELGVVAGRPL
jgi:hypothetical protein